MLCCKEHFFITLNCSSFAGNPRFCLCAYAWIYLQWLLCLTVPLCEWTWSVYCILCAYTHVWVLWVRVYFGCVQACASAHTCRGKVGFRICFFAVLHSHKACILPLKCIFRGVSLLFCRGGEENFVVGEREILCTRSVPEQCNLLSY